MDSEARTAFFRKKTQGARFRVQKKTQKRGQEKRAPVVASPGASGMLRGVFFKSLPAYYTGGGQHYCNDFHFSHYLPPGLQLAPRLFIYNLYNYPLFATETQRHGGLNVVFLVFYCFLYVFSL